MFDYAQLSVLINFCLFTESASWQSSLTPDTIGSLKCVQDLVNASKVCYRNGVIFVFVSLNCQFFKVSLIRTFSLPDILSRVLVTGVQNIL